MEEAFFFSLLRVSAAQILKASGFDKCKPLVLNIVTELYIKHFELVVSRARKFAIARTSAANDIAAQDVVEALLNIGFLKPSSDAADPQNERNTKSLKSFKNWAQYGDAYIVSRRLNTVPASLLANLVEKRKIDTSVETDQERKKRRLRETQEYFNQLNQGDESGESGKIAGELPADLDEDALTETDKLSWLVYLAEKDTKLGQNLKYVNTCIQHDLVPVHKLQKFHPTLPDGEDSFVLFKHQMHNANKNDHVLLQIQDEESYKGENKAENKGVLPSADLKSALPYNVKYDACLVADDLQQYLQYASTHEDEIRERLLELQGKDPDVEMDLKSTDEVHPGVVLKTSINEGSELEKGRSIVEGPSTESVKDGDTEPVMEEPGNEKVSENGEYDDLEKEEKCQNMT